MCNYTDSMNTAYSINTKNSKIFYTFYYTLSLCSSSKRLYCFPALVHQIMRSIKEINKFNHVEDHSNLIKSALLTMPQIFPKLRYFREKYKYYCWFVYLYIICYCYIFPNDQISKITLLPLSLWNFYHRSLFWKHQTTQTKGTLTVQVHTHLPQWKTLDHHKAWHCHSDTELPITCLPGTSKQIPSFFFILILLRWRRALQNFDRQRLKVCL